MQPTRRVVGTRERHTQPRRSEKICRIHRETFCCISFFLDCATTAPDQTRLSRRPTRLPRRHRPRNARNAADHQRRTRSCPHARPRAASPLGRGNCACRENQFIPMDTRENIPRISPGRPDTEFSASANRVSPLSATSQVSTSTTRSIHFRKSLCRS